MSMRKFKRQVQKNNGTLTYKKVVAKKRGCTVKELNKKIERKNRALKQGGEEDV